MQWPFRPMKFVACYGYAIGINGKRSNEQIDQLHFFQYFTNGNIVFLFPFDEADHAISYFNTGNISVAVTATRKAPRPGAA
mgnify:CR=1 FL=1